MITKKTLLPMVGLVTCLVVIGIKPSSAQSIPYDISGSVQSGFSFNQIEAGLGTVEADGANDNANQYYLQGSIEAGDLAFFRGRMKKTTFDSGAVDTENTSYELSLGVRQPLSNMTEAYGIVGVVNETQEASGIELDDTGYILGAGVRHHLNQQFDIEGEINYVKVFDEGEVSGTVAGMMEVGTQFQIGGAVDVADDATGLRAFARLGFL